MSVKVKFDIISTSLIDSEMSPFYWQISVMFECRFFEVSISFFLDKTLLEHNWMLTMYKTKIYKLWKIINLIEVTKSVWPRQNVSIL